VIYFSQIIIYSNKWPNGTRYDFPGVLVLPILVILSFSYFRGTYSLDLQKRKFDLFIYFYVMLFAILMIFHIGNIRGAQQKSEANVLRTLQFTNNMEQLAEAGKMHPDYAFIIQASDPGWDYEPVFSYSRFIRFYGAENAMFFLWAGPEPKKIRNIYTHALAVDLRDLSFNGAIPTKLPVSGHDFTPLPNISSQQSAHCILVVISGKPERNCPIVIESNAKQLFYGN
jgi:hypothetical protein